MSQKFNGLNYYKCGHYFRRDGKLLHRVVWEFHNGKIPDGVHVHHVNENRDDNTIENLVLKPVSKHLSDHAKSRVRYNLMNIERIRPLTKAWHSSEEGFAWHSERGKENWKLREDITYECTQCGKTFKTKHMYGENDNTFCSNNCKSQFRRESGVDNEERVCAQCGAKYKVNKYSKIATCSPNCAVKRRWGK